MADLPTWIQTGAIVASALATIAIWRSTNAVRDATRNAPVEATRMAQALNRTDALADERMRVLMRCIENAFAFAFAMQAKADVDKEMSPLGGSAEVFALSRGEMGKAQVLVHSAKALLMTDVRIVEHLFKGHGSLIKIFEQFNDLLNSCRVSQL